MPIDNQETPLRWNQFHSCPLCEGTEVNLLRSDNCITHPLWQDGLLTQMQWMHCKSCEHVYSRDYLNTEGLTLLFKRANPEQLGGIDLDRERFRWAPTVDRVQRHMPLAPWLSDDAVWLDVGCGSGGLVITAAEYGFAAIGVDARQQAVDRLAEMGYSAVLGDLLSLNVSAPVAVLSLADVLEHVPYPRQALQRAHSAIQESGLLVVSCPNLDSGSWRQNTAMGNNPYWSEIEHCHNFSRSSLMRLLAQERFIPLEYSISTRYKSCMEIVARRT